MLAKNLFQRQRRHYRLVWLVALLLVPTLTLAAAPKVVTTILPVHTLVSHIMQNIAIEPPQLLLNGSVSPHDYALRPSDMRLLHRADLIFLIDQQFELFLAKPLANLEQLQNIELAKSKGVELLPLRDTGNWRQPESAHNHGDHYWDYHLWLDPRNAIAMAQHISAVLINIDPANQAHYITNAEDLISRLKQLETNIKQLLTPVKDIPYVVFHDAYQYFENRFDMNAIGAVTLNPERTTSVKHIYQIKNQIESSGAVCIFSEPQFSSRLVKTLTESSSPKHAVLDPLGQSLIADDSAYFNLMINLAQSLHDCLTSTH